MLELEKQHSGIKNFRTTIHYKGDTMNIKTKEADKSQQVCEGCCFNEVRKDTCPHQVQQIDGQQWDCGKEELIYIKESFSYYEIFKDGGIRIYQYMLNNSEVDHEQKLCDLMDKLSGDKGLDRNSLYSEFIKTV